jgi:dihydroneopterin aldolase
VSETSSTAVVRALTERPLPHGAAGDAALDLIFIDGFVGETVIGIHDTELHRPQPVRIDLVAGVSRSLACSTDRIGDTIDYGAVRQALRRLLATHGLQLLEALAETIARMVLIDFGAEWVRVAVAKPRKFDDVDAVGVVIERRRPPAERLRVATTGEADAVLSLIGSGHVPDRR